VGLGAVGPDGAPAGKHVVGDDEGIMWPIEGRAGQRDFLVAKGRAVRARRSAFVGRAVSDGGLGGDQRRLVRGLGLGDRGGDGIGVVAVDRERVPAQRLEPRDLIVRNGQAGGPVDRDAVIVKEHDQLAEPEMPGERGRLVTDAFHQATVAGDAISVVVHQTRAEPRRKLTFRERHADGVRQALAERPGGRLDPSGGAVLRMTGGLGAELAEVSQLIDRHVLVSGEIQE
jgi:hypothetical protein